jgi:hypothetical protein
LVKFEIFKKLRNIKIKNSKKLESISRFLIKTEFKKFKTSHPTKFVEVQNIVKIMKKRKPADFDKNRAVFIKTARFPFLQCRLPATFSSYVISNNSSGPIERQDGDPEDFEDMSSQRARADGHSHLCTAASSLQSRGSGEAARQGAWTYVGGGDVLSDLVVIFLRVCDI